MAKKRVKYEKSYAQRNPYKPATTAAKEYASQRAAVVKLMSEVTSELKDELKELDEHHKKAPLSWGVAGSMGRLKVALGELLDLMNQE